MTMKMVKLCLDVYEPPPVDLSLSLDECINGAAKSIVTQVIDFTYALVEVNQESGVVELCLADSEDHENFKATAPLDEIVFFIRSEEERQVLLAQIDELRHRIEDAVL